MQPITRPAVPPKSRQTDVLRALLMHHLAPHCGRAQGIKGELLASGMGVHPRTLRSLISAARADGAAICGKPETGYFIAITPAEIDETCAFHRKRALHELHQEAQLRRIPLPVLLGQLHLHT